MDRFLESANRLSHQVNSVSLFLLGVSLFFVTLIATLVVVFIFKYRHTSQNPIAQDVKNHTGVEVAWTLIPLAITIIAFAWGARQFMEFLKAPADATEISVIGRQWMWKFRSIGGVEEINELHLPVDRAIRMTMISQDVIHSFYVPQLRVKYDVLPGRYTQVWFQPDRIGSYPLLCTQYCGTDHSKMIGRLIVMSGPDFEAWASGQRIRSESSAFSKGAKLFQQHACVSCHDTHGIGPSLNDVAGSLVTVHSHGRRQEIRADDDYLRRSILDPAHDVVDGYRDVMPSFRGQLSEDEISLLIVYMKSLKSAEPKTSTTSRPAANSPRRES